MSKNKPLSHYVPKFSSKSWADDSEFVSYLFCEHTSSVKKTSKGKKQWGRQRGLYSWKIEQSLDRDLETKVAPIYEKLTAISELDEDERFLWAQFLLSQLVRTPNFIRYEKVGIELTGCKREPLEDRVGCPDCLDLNYIANRDWLLLMAHEDDYFVRSDNPILQTGFIELNDTCLYYPLTPRLCFVVCSMREGWNAFEKNINPTIGYELPKGWAHMLNFYFAKSAGDSLIISPEHDGAIAEQMFSKTLGVYPQPPFPMHITTSQKRESAYRSIKYIMSVADNIEYPDWNVSEIQPMYQLKED